MGQGGRDPISRKSRSFLLPKVRPGLFIEGLGLNRQCAEDSAVHSLALEWVLANGGVSCAFCVMLLCLGFCYIRSLA